jgi:hypothetical protein
MRVCPGVVLLNNSLYACGYDWCRHPAGAVECSIRILIKPFQHTEQQIENFHAECKRQTLWEISRGLHPHRFGVAKP